MSTDRSDEHDLSILPSGSSDTGESALPAGAKVGEFRIERLVGEGGFGIVYLAYDESLDRTVALKEYMPSQLAQRAPGTFSVQVRSQRYAETFDAALRSFINEAKLLARFDHPSLLKVYRFFQANGTAYMAMPFYEGQTLKAVLRGLSGPPDERWLRRMLYQLLDGLEVIHAYECYHRDIAPDNILLQNDTPILLDFGAARRVIGDITRTLTVILKPGYAPIEQYGEDANLKQGAWTDIYALAGVVHFALTREAPPASIARAMTDQLVPLAQRLRGIYSDGLLTTIDAALSVRPQDRPQSVAQLRSMLLASDAGAYSHTGPALAIRPLPASAQATDAAEPESPPAEPPPVRAKPRAAVGASGSPLRTAITAIVLAAPAAIGAVWWASSRLAEAPPSEGRPAAVANEVPAPESAAKPEQAAPGPAPTPVPQVARVEPRPEPPAPKAEAAKAPVEAARVEPKPPVTTPLRPDAGKAKAAEPPKPAAVAETKPAPVPPRADVRPAPRAEETVEAPKPPPQQVARVEPKPEPPPPAPKAETPKPPVEVARIEPKPAPAPPPAAPALTGRYTGRLVADGSPVPITLQILAVDNGSVSATANQSTGRCEGDYRMTGTVLNDSLRMRSTHSGGRYGDCSFGFRVAIQGAKLVGQTTTGSPLELSR